ncbi:GNAT family N-acetyltransferase [Aquiflexum sp.]|uniref:GNAT family N-acetyltransferase n=1 Tax=Aquiflexum sp. TaxID=1872584 RepID=UPI0035937C81
MKIQHEEDDKKGYFYIEIEGKRKAEMVYSKAGANLLIIEHTEVSDELRGTGSGNKLVLAAVELARSQNKKILPLCPFAKSVFKKQPEIQDVLK